MLEFHSDHSLSLHGNWTVPVMTIIFPSVCLENLEWKFAVHVKTRTIGYGTKRCMAPTLQYLVPISVTVGMLVWHIDNQHIHVITISATTVDFKHLVWNLWISSFLRQMLSIKCLPNSKQNYSIYESVFTIFDEQFLNMKRF